MKKIVIISGKGGTGKTSVASSFIKLAKEHVAVDCDVDAANLHILLNPSVKKKEKFTGGAIARVTGDCINCGRCEELCRFEAIKDSETDIKIDELKCESCGICEYICPTEAIELIPEEQGEYYISDSKYCSFVHARLNPGAENSGLLVTKIRNISEDIALAQNKKTIIIDGAPGIGCPVIASLNGVDYALIVTEPTISAISDFKKIYEVTGFFNIKTFVCINKYDISAENSVEIEKFCNSRGIDMIGKIPYDDNIPRLLAQKKLITDIPESPAAKEVIKIWQKLEPYLYN
jgi:MinD superfamily P-loop ATPase